MSAALSAVPKARSCVLSRGWMLGLGILASIPWTAAQSAPAASHEPAPAHPTPVGSKPPAAPPSLKLQLEAAEQAVASAPNLEAAGQAWDRAEALRKRALTGGSKLLLQEADEKAESGNLHVAVRDLSAALTLQPDSVILRRMRAELRLTGNDPTGAVEDLGVALQQDPGDPTAWFLLAKAEETLHNGDAALEAFQHVLKLAPLFPDKETLLRQFRHAARGQPD